MFVGEGVKDGFGSYPHRSKIGKIRYMESKKLRSGFRGLRFWVILESQLAVRYSRYQDFLGFCMGYATQTK